MLTRLIHHLHRIAQSPAAEQSRRVASHRRSARLHTETLEARQLFAGVVNVSVTAAGDVTLQGDNLDNYVYVRPLGPSLEIEGYDGTVISMDGLTNQSILLFPNVVPRDFRIDLRGGADELTLQDVAVGRHLTLNGGIGNTADHIALEDVTVGGNLRADLGASAVGEEEDFNFWGGSVSGSMVINQTGNQALIGLVGMTAQGRLSINTGSGDDEVIFEQTQVFGSTSINTGLGADFVSLEQFTSYGRVNVNTSSGGDEVTIEQAIATQPYRLDLGSGNDQLAFIGPVNSVFFESFQANGGSGNDSVLAHNLPEYGVDPVFSSFESMTAGSTGGPTSPWATAGAGSEPLRQEYWA